MRVRIGLYDLEITAKNNPFPEDCNYTEDDVVLAFLTSLSVDLYEASESYKAHGFNATSRSADDKIKGIYKVLKERGKL